jgi:hypothetical protein
LIGQVLSSITGSLRFDGPNVNFPDSPLNVTSASDCLEIGINIRKEDVCTSGEDERSSIFGGTRGSGMEFDEGEEEDEADV